MIHFVPQGVNPREDFYQKGEDYYDRIRDVIDRVCSYNAPAKEVEVAYAYYAEMNLTKSNQSRSSRFQKQSIRSQSTKIDLSWKYGGTAFPKRSSRVGSLYQVPQIPAAGTFSAEEAKLDPDLQ